MSRWSRGEADISSSAYTFAYDASRFGSAFEPFGVLRRRRNAAVANARTIIEAAGRLLEHLGLF